MFLWGATGLWQQMLIKNTFDSTEAWEVRFVSLARLIEELTAPQARLKVE